MESEESESESEEHELPPKPEAVFNVDGMRDKLEDIGWGNGSAAWVHSLSIDVDQEQQVDVNDDLNRELAFYMQALEGTRRAFEKLEKMGVPFLRPSDYYAEMVKSDHHMEKVKTRLLTQKRKTEEAEERKKAREAKRAARETQAQRHQERALQKKTEMESIKKWRKERKQQIGPQFDFDVAGEVAAGQLPRNKSGVHLADRSGGMKKRSGKINRKRVSRNSKFGYGGRRGLDKQNTQDSMNQFRHSRQTRAPRNQRRR